MDSTYAPQSPDLSSFLSSNPPPPPPEPAYLSQQTREDSYQRPQSSEDSYQSSYTPRSPTLPFAPHHQSQLQEHPQEQLRSFSLGERAFSDYSDSTQYMPPVSALPPSRTQSFAGAATSSSSSYHPQPIKTEPSHHQSYDPITGSMSRAPRVKDEPSSTLLSSGAQSHIKLPPPSVDIRTKFPVARIKRIMQADEEVGKVAQVTPVAVNKALELFMTALVLGAAERAREKGGKRITAAHLKSVVEADDQFDFLGEIVGRVQDAAEGDKKRKAGKDSDSDGDSGERKVKKGKGRRKKNDE